MPNDRLRQVEKNLNRLREQLAGKEDTLTTIAPEERVRIKQQISDLKAEIRDFEIEYWQILAEQPVKGALAEAGSAARQQKRSDEQRDILQAEWDMRLEKLRRLRNALAIETGVATVFQLEKQIEAEEAALIQLRERLEQLEQMSSREQRFPAAATTSDLTPELVVAELVERSGQLRTSQDYSDEVLAWLQKIYAEVSKPEAPAAAKLKAALSLLPPFVSVSGEAEVDVEKFLKQHFPTFRRWAGALAKKA